MSELLARAAPSLAALLAGSMLTLAAADVPAWVELPLLLLVACAVVLSVLDLLVGAGGGAST